MATVYHYTTRPAQDSGKLLIDFLSLPDDKDFIKQLIRALEPVDIQVINYEDLWMNDEIVLNATSTVGYFTIYRDASGYYFITANENEDAILLIDAILAKNPLYKKA